ncbi:uncharacterized protein [Haliotis asinina]|uniref:uncharacterized protein n=1 Tax=Haliotis asinina TaxID=109174 RepID=UPI00353186EF
MKVIIFLILATADVQWGLSKQYPALDVGHSIRVPEGREKKLPCRIRNAPHNCSSLYKRFYWEAHEKRFLQQKIINNGCIVELTIKSTSSDAGRYSCILIAQDSYEVKEKLTIFISPKDRQGVKCSVPMFKCVPQGHCIFQRYRCDGFDDCHDGSDETNCEKDKCADKFVCDNYRCINKDLQCNKQDDCGDNSDEDMRCQEDQTPAFPEDDHFDWLKTTVYTVIGCTVAVVIFISLIVIVVFRVKMKRLRARRIARAIERHRQHQGSSSQCRNQEQDPFLAIGSNSHYGNIIVNVNNGVQYVPTGDFASFVDSPPPYHEVVALERDSSPPPPYSTIDRTPRQKPGTSATLEDRTNPSGGDVRETAHQTSDMSSIQEDISDLVEALTSETTEASRNSRSDVNPPVYPGSAWGVAASHGLAAATPTPSHSNPSSNRESVHDSSRDCNPSTSDTVSRSRQSLSSNTGSTSLPRPARLAVQGGKIVLSAEDLEPAGSSNQLNTSQDDTRPRQCHLEVKEGQIVLTDVTRSELGVQSPLNADSVMRGTGELEVRDGQIIFRPKET